MGIGKDLAHGGVSVTGGLQDNGQSILRSDDKVMGSDFGGDGGDTLADQANGCDIAEEYVYLAVQITQNCAVNDGSWVNDASKVTSYNVAPADNATSEARFIAPLAADMKNSSTWIAGGRHVLVQTHGYAIRSSSEYDSVYDLGAGRTATAVAASGGKVYAAWCGPLQQPGLRARNLRRQRGRHGLARRGPAGGRERARPACSGFAVDPKNADHVYLEVNGFSRHWTEGPAPARAWAMSSSPRTAAPPGPTSPRTCPTCRPTPRSSRPTVSRRRHRPGCHLAGPYDMAARRPTPAVAVLQLKLSPDGGTLYAATHGREHLHDQGARLRLTPYARRR